MLADTISGQLVAERHRAILHEAKNEALARRASDPQHHYKSRTRRAMIHAADSLRTALFVRIRPIRPADEPLIREGFSRLSPESRRLRFFVSKKSLTAKELQYFTNVDHHDHEALVAVSRFDGRGLGVVRYIRDKQDHDAAELAVTVVDEWQGRGLGTKLSRQLAERARCEGIHRFTATVLDENAGARRLLPKVGATRLVERDRETLEFEVALAPVASERRALRWYQLAPATDPCRGV